MSRYLRLTPGNAVKTIGVCARCQFKKQLVQLKPDPNSPGLMVCDDCRDLYDPYRLPARTTEKITVRNPRPDTPLEVQDDG